MAYFFLAQGLKPDGLIDATDRMQLLTGFRKAAEAVKMYSDKFAAVATSYTGKLSILGTSYNDKFI